MPAYIYKHVSPLLLIRDFNYLKDFHIQKLFDFLKKDNLENQSKEENERWKGRNQDKQWRTERGQQSTTAFYY